MDIHIIGTEHSFTYDATIQRYDLDDNHQNAFVANEHPELVANLLNKKISSESSAVVPLWNSNTGKVDFDRETNTADLFLKARPVCDLWPYHIVFKLAINTGKYTDRSKVFSVKVARSQCSHFLKRNNVIEDERFIDSGSTTQAAKKFVIEAGSNDVLLCSKELIEHNGLKTLPNRVTNPNNFTIFSTFNRVPKVLSNGQQISLGCVLVNLNGKELPTEFIRYYKTLFTLEEIQESNDVSLTMPKILFIWRYEKSKALVLLEMDAGDYTGNPWPPPDIDSDESESQEWDFCDQVGRINESFSENVASLFTNEFKTSSNVFYGHGDCYMWVCPALNISVHGFDKNLVRTCAKIQVLHLKEMLDSGFDLSEPAKKILKDFDDTNLKLTSESEPDFPHV